MRGLWSGSACHADVAAGTADRVARKNWQGVLDSWVSRFRQKRLRSDEATMMGTAQRIRFGTAACARLLVVDDVAILPSLHRGLELAGFDVETAGGGDRRRAVAHGPCDQRAGGPEAG